MRRVVGTALCLAVAGLASLASAQTVSMNVTSLGNNILGGVYVGPYYATIGNETNVPIICDDFYDATYVNTPWQATTTTVAQNGPTWLTKKLNLSPAAQKADYAQAAYLAQQMVSPSVTCPLTANCTGDIQFAIWSIFDPVALLSISGKDLINASYWLLQANLLYAQNAIPTSQFSNVSVYSPYPSGPPQEFLRVKTPEAPVLATLGAELLAVGGLAFFIRRRRIRSVVSTGV